MAPTPWPFCKRIISVRFLLVGRLARAGTLLHTTWLDRPLTEEGGMTTLGAAQRRGSEHKRQTQSSRAQTIGLLGFFIVLLPLFLFFLC